MCTAVEIILAFLAAGGLLALCWVLFGQLLTPVTGGRVLALVRAKDSAEELEHDVAGLLWLKGSGLSKCAVVIVDEGLNEKGRAVAAALLGQEEGLRLCSAEELAQLLRQE